MGEKNLGNIVKEIEELERDISETDLTENRVVYNGSNSEVLKNMHD